MCFFNAIGEIDSHKWMHACKPMLSMQALKHYSTSTQQTMSTLDASLQFLCKRVHCSVVWWTLLSRTKAWQEERRNAEQRRFEGKSFNTNTMKAFRSADVNVQIVFCVFCFLRISSPLRRGIGMWIWIVLEVKEACLTPLTVINNEPKVFLPERGTAAPSVGRQRDYRRLSLQHWFDQMHTDLSLI